MEYQSYVKTEDVQYLSLSSLEISLYSISLSIVLVCLFSRYVRLFWAHILLTIRKNAIN